MKPVKLYDRVRSFDFGTTWYTDQDGPAPTHTSGSDLEGERACYVEGQVLGIVEPHEVCPVTGYRSVDCPRVCISVSRRVFAGKVRVLTTPEFVYPPQNGVPASFGGVCDGIEIIGAFEQRNHRSTDLAGRVLGGE